MGINTDRLYQIKDGIEIKHDTGVLQILAESFDPSEQGVDSPVGSLFVRTNSQIYKKIGPLDTDWIDINQPDLATQQKLLRLQKDLMTASLELSNFMDKQYDPSLSFFVCSFETLEDIDISSQNYHIKDGSVSADISNPQLYKISTKTLFDLGVFNNIESFLDIGGNGAIRKTKLIAGNNNIIENFEDVSNVYYEKENVILSLDFETGSDDEITYELLTNHWQNGITSNNIIGNYGIRIGGNDRALIDIDKDLTQYTDIKFRFYVSMDVDTGESMCVGFYDGSTWHTIYNVGVSENGYITLSIPDAYLANGTNRIAFDLTNNGVLFGGTNNYNDAGYFDEVLLYTTENIPIEQTSNIYNIYEGDYSGKHFVDFSETNVINIDTGLIDLSLYKYLRIYMRKPNNGIFQYSLKIYDNNNDVYTVSDISFPNTTQWFKTEIELEDTTIDNSQIVKVQIEFIESLQNSELMQIYSTSGSNWVTFTNQYFGKQTFIPTEDITVGRMKLYFRTRANKPRVPLYVGLANLFETTYALARFDGGKLSGDSYSTISEVIAEFDNNVTLYAGQIYSLLFKTTESNWNYAWDLQTTTAVFDDVTFYLYQGYPQSNVINFSLYSPLPKEEIYLDNLEAEAESTYETTGDYESNIINLGMVPDSFNELIINREGNEDTLTVYARSSNSPIDIETGSWINISGGNSLSLIPANQFLQYRIEFSGLSTNSDIIKDVTVSYDLDGTIPTTIVCKMLQTDEEPTKFMIRTQDSVNNGFIEYYITRNGSNWQYVGRNFDNYIDFTSAAGFGSNVQVKAEMSDDAIINGFSVITDKGIIT